VQLLKVMKSSPVDKLTIDEAEAATNSVNVHLLHKRTGGCIGCITVVRAGA